MSQRKDGFASRFGDVSGTVAASDSAPFMATTGLFPFNPDGVPRTTPKPPAQPTGPEAGTVQVDSYPQDEVIKTPVTPVSAEALTSL